jgi:hypothetical protein
MSNQRVTAHAKASSPQGWLKINGLSNERIDEKCDFRGFRHDEGQTVPRKGRPRLKAGDYVILGHLGTRKNGKNDLCIYGRGTVAVEHRDGVDELPRWLKKGMDKSLGMR